MKQAARIDLIGLCTDAGAACRGAAMGPEALRIAGLVETLSALGHQVADLGDVRAPAPEASISAPANWRLPSRRQAEVLAIAAEGSARSFKSLRGGGLPVFLGGDHSISMGSISGVARHCAETGKPLFVLWVDAHADFNTPATSPTGNLHGMSLALLCGEPEFGDAFGGSWRGVVDPRNVTIFAARSIDREERDLLAERGVEVIDMRMIDEIGATAALRGVIDRIGAAGGHLHLSFDVDSIDPSLAPGTGTRVEGGLTYREAHLMMEMLHDSGLVGSADIVEVNPYLDHAGQTAELVVGLAASLFGRQIVARAPARTGMMPAERAYIAP